MSGTEHYGKICFHCGYDYALHHYETMQCPKGGEACGDKKQEWLKTTFVPLAPEPVEREVMNKSKINDGGSAFPGIAKDNTEILETIPGMSLRDYFAAKAMQGMVSGNIQIYSTDLTIPKIAYDLADAMIAERKK